MSLGWGKRYLLVADTKNVAYGVDLRSQSEDPRDLGHGDCSSAHWYTFSVCDGTKGEGNAPGFVNGLDLYSPAYAIPTNQPT